MRLCRGDKMRHCSVRRRYQQVTDTRRQAQCVTFSLTRSSPKMKTVLDSVIRSQAAFSKSADHQDSARHSSESN